MMWHQSCDEFVAYLKQYEESSPRRPGGTKRS